MLDDHIRPDARPCAFQRIKGGLDVEGGEHMLCDMVAHLPQNRVTGRCCKNPLQHLRSVNTDQSGTHQAQMLAGCCARACKQVDIRMLVGTFE